VNKRQQDLAYIETLREILEANGIEIPPGPEIEPPQVVRFPEEHVMPDGSFESLNKTISQLKHLINIPQIDVQFRNLSFWGMVPKTRIPTVGSTFRDLFLFGTGPKQRVDILKNLTGRISTGKMTLVMGPPGCGMFIILDLFLCSSSHQFSPPLVGKSSFLKALAGQLYLGGNKLDGSITYNGDTADSGKFRLPKIADYIDEKDQHASTLYESTDPLTNSDLLLVLFGKHLNLLGWCHPMGIIHMPWQLMKPVPKSSTSLMKFVPR
jgi:hypothetical protein